MMSVRAFLILATCASAQDATIDTKPTADKSHVNDWEAAAQPGTGSTLTHKSADSQKNAGGIAWVAPATAPTDAPAAASVATFVGGALAPSLPQAQGARFSGAQAIGPDSMAVVGGLVEAFMHKVQLQPGEKACLENNAGQLTGDIMGTVGDIVIAAKTLVAGHGTVNKESTGSLITTGMDSAVKVASLVTLATQLMKNCVHGDALAFMKTAVHHLQDATYLDHQFVANGVDIAHGLADSVVAFEAQDFHRFGADIGVSLRKILLSTNTVSTKSMLPEGIPDQVIIQKATDGLMKGFFVTGSGIEITDTADPSLDINIDLHQCIAGNSVFFKELWLSAWDLFAQLSLNGKQHGLGPLPAGQKGQPKWSSELMMAMMQFPSALLKCGVGKEMQKMFMEAIRSMNDVQVHFNFPADGQENNGAAIAEGATNNMAKAVAAWTAFDFEKFGFALGSLFREMVLLALPQKYEVGANGRLQLSAKTHTMQHMVSQAGSAYVSFVVIGSSTISLCFAMAAFRTYRSKKAQPCERMLAMEGVDAEAAE